MLATVVLFGLLLLATATDLVVHRIYNWTTYSGILLAWGMNMAGGLLARTQAMSPQRLAELGWIGLGPSVLGCLVCGFILLVCYVLFQVGGGDVKLMAMLGAFLGPDRGIEALLWTFVVGGCMAVIVLIWRVGTVRLLTRVLRQIVWTLRLGWWSPLTADERAQLQPPLYLAPSALAAAVIVRFGLVEMM